MDEEYVCYLGVVFLVVVLGFWERFGWVKVIRRGERFRNLGVGR